MMMGSPSPITALVLDLMKRYGMPRSDWLMPLAHEPVGSGPVLSAATSVGPDHAACLFFGLPGIDNDVWYCWTSDCDGQVTVSTVGLTVVDTKIAVYDG